MKLNDQLEYDDIGEAVRENRALHPARSYRFLYAQGDLNFRQLSVADPVPLGRQILESAGVDSKEDFSLFAILATGDFEDVRLDETYDLRQRGAERFVAFQTDRNYKLTLKDRQLEWGKPAINGAALYALAKVADDEAVFLEVRGGEDRLIGHDEIIDLTAPGVERFIVGLKPVLKYEIIVNGRPRFVEDKKVTFEQVVRLAFPAAQASNIIFEANYRNAASSPHAGDLSAGGVVEVKAKGTIFNVTRCVQS